MSDSFLKTPLGQNLNALATKRAQDAIQLLGKALPASVVSVQKNGTIVTVKFELGAIPFTLPRVKMPVLTSEYVRLPIAIGCRGLVVPADAYLGGVSGLGGGTADLTPQSNLGALVFAPLGNVDFPDVVAGVLTLYGPNGVTIRNASGSASITINAAGRIDIQTAGGVWMNGVRVDQPHLHSGVEVGGGNSGPPTP